MSVLYVLSPGSYLRKIGERLLIGTKDGRHKSLPVQQIEQVVASRNGHITAQAIFALLEHRIPLVYVDRLGHIAGVLGPLPATLQRSRCQWTYFSAGPQQILLIRNLLAVKLQNQQQLLKTYAKSKQREELSRLVREIQRYGKKVQIAADVEELRGLEGMAARTYFQAVPLLVDAARWPWQGRNRRPPKDPLNSMLSFGYTFLEREVRIAIAGAGLDCRFGFFHSNDGRKDSLVFDLMELFRTNVIDRFVFRSANLKIFSPEQFQTNADGCRFKKEYLSLWIEQYEKYMHTSFACFEDRSPRQWIRVQVEDFAKHLFTASDVIS